MTHHDFSGQRFMLRLGLLIFTLTAGPYAAATGTEAATDIGASALEKLERGKYLVTVAGCNDCHTPFVMGPSGPEPPGRSRDRARPHGRVEGLPGVEP